MTGSVVVSLDFELGWGHRKSRPRYVERLRSDVEGTLHRVRSLIDLFDEHGIPAIWVVVGELVTDGDDPLFHNPELFEYLLDANVTHEIGLHSHTHPDFTRISRVEAKQELMRGIDALADWDINPKMFVFPQERIGHFDLLSEFGLNYYRLYTCQSRIERISRLILPPVVSLPLSEEEPINVPGTMFLADGQPKRVRSWNVKRSLKRAAETEGLVHFWLHPHNVVTDHTLLDHIDFVPSEISAAERRGDVNVADTKSLTA